MSILRAETTVAEAPRRHVLTVADTERFFRTLQEECV
jgi:hypothetical protein